MKEIKRKNGNLSVGFIAILFIISSLQVTAKTPYEFSVYAGGGYSFFLYRPYTDKVPVPKNDKLRHPIVSGPSSSGASGDLGVGFTGFVAPQVGLHVGLGFGFYNIGVKVDSLKSYTKDLFGYENTDYYWDLYSTLSDYRETHRTFCLTIPLMLQFQSKQSQAWSRKADLAQGFYAMIGFKFNVLLSNTYETKVTTFYNIAHNIDLDNWADTQEFAGLGRFEGKSANGNFGYIQALFAFEAGMKWRIANNMYLYTGAYLDYGLNDPAKNNREPIGGYTSPEALEELALLDFSPNTHLMTIGVKVRLAFIKNLSRLSCPQF
jgi:hypothetical protein